MTEAQDIHIIVGSRKCPGCHGGDFADFDHYMEINGIPQEDAPGAFADWLHAFSDGAWSGEAVPYWQDVESDPEAQAAMKEAGL